MKKVMALILSLAILVTFVSCGKKSGNTEAAVTATASNKENTVTQYAESMTIGTLLDVESFNPWLMASNGREQVIYNKIYETLAFLRPDGTREYVLATSIEDMGNSCYKIKLYDNIYDSNGNQITSSDVVFSYNQCFKTGQLAWGIKYLDHFDVINDYELDMYLNQESAVALDMVLKTCHIVDEDSYNASPDGMATTPVGTGPYVMSRYVPGSEVVLERRDYWQKDENAVATSGIDGSIKTVTYKIISDTSQLALALEMGDIDGSVNIVTADLDTFLNADRTPKKGYNSVQTLGALLFYISYNCSENSPFKDIRVRQAVSYAIDMEAIALNVYGSDGSVAHTNSSIYYNDYDSSLNEHIPYKYDVEKAKALLKDAGYENGLTLSLIINNEYNYAQTASLVQAYLKNVGISVNISTYEPAMFNTLINDPTAFDMYMNCTMSLNTPGRMGLFDLNGYSTGVNGVFVNDQVLQEKFELANMASTYSTETVTNLLNYVEEMAYNYPMYYSYNYIITLDKVENIVYDRNNAIVPNACTVLK